MDLELIMLGTGNAMVTKCYNTCFLIRNQEEYLLVDAGGGNEILRRLEQIEFCYDKLKGMVITHAHTDHILGAIWIIRKLASLIISGKYTDKFMIYCHDEVAAMLPVLCSWMLTPKMVTQIGTNIIIRQVTDGETQMSTGLKFTFFDIYSSKIKQYGFQASLPNGKRLTCLGDEPFHQNCRQYAQGVDFLLSEAFCLYADRDIYHPYDKKHSTVADAGKLAQELEVSNLILYHTEDDRIAERKQLYTQEAAAFFKGTIYVPDDMEVIQL